jgi:hypothetical protein
MAQQHLHLNNHQSKFKNFVESLVIDDTLRDAILEGYDAIFTEANTWAGYGTGDTAGPGKFRTEPSNDPGRGLYSKPEGANEISGRKFADRMTTATMPVAGAPFTPRAFGTQPMGSYDNIFKTVSSGQGLTGDVAEPGNNYSYNIPLPNVPISTRDIKEETIKDWGKPYKFPKQSWQPAKMTDRLMKKAQGHLPIGATVPNLAPPVYNNYNNPSFGVDSYTSASTTATLGSPGP